MDVGEVLWHASGSLEQHAAAAAADVSADFSAEIADMRIEIAKKDAEIEYLEGSLEAAIAAQSDHDRPRQSQVTGMQHKYA